MPMAVRAPWPGRAGSPRQQHVSTGQGLGGLWSSLLIAQVSAEAQRGETCLRSHVQCDPVTVTLSPGPPHCSPWLPQMNLSACHSLVGPAR